MKKLVIAHISDTHIHNGSEFKKDIFKKAITEINEISPDLVVHTGDLTNNGLKEDYELARNLLLWFNKKPIVLMGNHDAKNVGYRLFEDYIGTSDVVFGEKNFLFIGVETTIPDRDEGMFGEMHMKWVKGVLKEKGDGKIKILAFHHHLVPVPDAGRERSTILDAGDMLKIILDYGVDIVLNGHRHVYAIFKVEDTVVINAGTLSHVKTRAYQGRSYNLINISDKGIKVSARPLNGGNKKDYVGKVGRDERLIHVNLPRVSRIIQISDTHFTRSTFRLNVYDTSVRIINRLKPDIVVHCGDVTSDGMPESFEMAAKLLQKIEAPKIIIPGPNDFKNIGDLIFEDYFGVLNPIVRDKNLLVIGVNSSHKDFEGGVIGRTHLKVILEELEKGNLDVVKCVAFHHHLMPIPNVREDNVLEDAGQILFNMSGSADVVLTGHKQISSSLIVNDCLIVNSGTISGGKYQNPYGNSFNLIDVFSNKTAVVTEINGPTGIRRIVGTYKLRNR